MITWIYEVGRKEEHNFDGCLVILYGIMERKSSDLFFQIQLRFLFKMIIECILYRKFSSRYTRFLKYNVTLRRIFVQR